MRILSFLSICGLLLSAEEADREAVDDGSTQEEEEESSCGCGKNLNRNSILADERERGEGKGDGNGDKILKDMKSECPNLEKILMADDVNRMAFVEGGRFYMGTSKPMIALVPFPLHSSPLMSLRMGNHRHDSFS